MYWIGSKKAVLIEAKRPKSKSFDSGMVKVHSDLIKGRFYLVPFTSTENLMSQFMEVEADCFFTLNEKRVISFTHLTDSEFADQVNLFLNNRKVKKIKKDVDNMSFLVHDIVNDSYWGF